MDFSALPLRSHPVVPGIDIDPLFQRIRGIDSTASQPAAPHARRPSRDDAGSARPSTNPSSRHSSPGRRPSLDAVDRPGPPPDHHRSQPEYSGMDPSAYVDPRMPLPQPPPAWSTAAVPPWSTSTRPLSDIRELTEPSLVEVSNRKDFGGSNLNNNAGNNVHRRPSLSRKPSVKTATRPDQKPIPSTTCTEEKRGRRSPVCSPGSPADRSSVYSLPPGSVPPRSSSQPRRQRSVSHPRGPGVSVGVGGGLGLAPPPPPPRGQGHTIPNRGKSRSPVREVAARLDPVSSDSSRRIPSRTFTRNPQPSDILEFPSHRHHRITVELQLAASLFVGGGSIEGSVRIVVDEADRIRHRKTLALARISVDLVGVEEMSGAKRAVFLNLATELVDSENPPPRSMVDSQKQASPVDPFWYLLPSVSTLPFILSLPLDVGPPPFQSKHARIRYVVCVTLLVRDTGKQYLVRSSQDVAVLSVYDPEKALMSLPSPLTASDELFMPRGGAVEVIRVTAGLHRQVWVSGTSIFVDVHIANHSRKSIKKIELQLERDILCYKHAAAGTMEKSASQARIFDSNERSILNKTTIKSGTVGWNGVAAHSTDIRTCDLEIPRGHATVKCGKYFEVRYFLNIIVHSSHSRVISVQLPIVLIHMNSLDIVPNSVAQVAAAIEEKRQAHLHPHHRHHHHHHQPPPVPLPTHTRSSSASPRPAPRIHHHQHPHHIPTRRPSQSRSLQGRAFAAPCTQSLERARAEAEELQHLAHALEASPRRQPRAIRRVQSSFEYHTPPSNRKGRVLRDDDVVEIRRRLLRHARSNETNRTAGGGGGSSVPSGAGHGGVTSERHGGIEESRPNALGPGPASAAGGHRGIRPAGATASALGFRDAELERDFEYDDEDDDNGLDGNLDRHPHRPHHHHQQHQRQHEYKSGTVRRHPLDSSGIANAYDIPPRHDIPPRPNTGTGTRTGTIIRRPVGAPPSLSSMPSITPIPSLPPPPPPIHNHNHNHHNQNNQDNNNTPRPPSSLSQAGRLAVEPSRRFEARKKRSVERWKKAAGVAWWVEGGRRAAAERDKEVASWI